MFSLRSNLACPAGPISLSLVQPHSLRSPNPGKDAIMVDTQSRKPKGGRPKGDPATVRTMTIGVRVSTTEYAQLRPDGDHGLVLLKGLSKANLETLKNSGFGPAAVVDAGGGSYQAWVRLSEKPLAERLRELAGSGLHKGIGLHAGLAVGLSDGRLAGFTNRSMRTDRDAHPYALLLESAGKRAVAASAYLDQLQSGRFNEKKTEVNRQHPRSRGPSR